jgi:hypothetical protein
MARNLQLLIVAISSFVVGFFVDDFSSTSESITQYHSIAAVSQNQTVEKKYAEAMQEIQQLKIQLAKNQISLPSLSTSSLKSSPNIQTENRSERALHVAESKLAELRAENYMKWVVEQSKKNGGFSLGDEMKTRFDSESVNQEWAPVQEKKIAGLFIDNAELSGFALKEAKCHATQCQISIGVTDVEQANLIAEKFSKIAAENKFMSMIAVPDTVTGKTTLYVSSEDQGFEFN